MAMSRSLDSTSLTTWPSMAIVPPLISSSPASMRSSVDLPQPEGPTSTVNSPSAMSKAMPWMTLTAPKVFSTLQNETDATSGLSPGRRKAGLRRLGGQRTNVSVGALHSSALHGAGREARDHVALERVVDRRRRQRIEKTGRHEQLPWRIIRGKKAAEGDAERRAPVVGEEQECKEIFVPGEQQRIGADGDQRRQHERQVDEAKELQRRGAVDTRSFVELEWQLVGGLFQHPDRIRRCDRHHRQDERPLAVEKPVTAHRLVHGHGEKGRRNE